MTQFLRHQRINWLIIMIAILPLLLACTDEPKELSPPYGFVAPPPKFELKREVFGDPDSFDQPRIQFMWQGPKRKRKEIWSVKIDGTDLRLAVDKELLYSGDTSNMYIARYPIRSPDNRYILAQFSKPGRRFQVYLIDLKDQTKKFLTECQIGKAPWTGDSNSFFCAFYDDLKRFYLDSEKSEIFKKPNHGIYYVQQNAERIYQMTKEGFIVWDFNGKQLQKEILGNIHNLKHYVSADGQFLYFERMSDKNGSIIHLKDVKSEISVPSAHTPLITSTNGQYYISTGDLSKYDKNSNTVTNIFTKIGGRKYNDEYGYTLGEFTLFNERINNGK